MIRVAALEAGHRPAWEALVGAHPQAGFMQSWAWSAFKEAEGYRPLRLGCFLEDTLVGGAIGYTFPSPVEAALAAIPDGPILPWSAPEAREAFDALIATFRDAPEMARVAVMRVEPRVGAALAPAWLAGFPRAPLDLVPDASLEVELRSPEALLAGMRPKGRYNVRLALRRGVTVTSTAEPAAVHDFYPVVAQTARYQDFRLEPKAFFVNMAQRLCLGGLGRFAFARYKGMILAAAFTVRFGDTVTFLYGGHVPLFSEVMASYALHYLLMCEAQQDGFRRYDLYGYVSPGLPGHPYDGFSRFKEKLGGQPVQRVGSRDIVFYDRLADAAVRAASGPGEEEAA